MREKELADRALRLAEVRKPKSNWELQGLLGLAAFAFGFLSRKAISSSGKTLCGETVGFKLETYDETKRW